MVTDAMVRAKLTGWLLGLGHVSGGSTEIITVNGDVTILVHGKAVWFSTEVLATEEEEGRR